MKKKYKRNKNQRSFYFEDYLETNKKNKIIKKNNNFQDRIYILFFFFFSLVLIFSIKITHISLSKKEIFNLEKQTSKFSFTPKSSGYNFASDVLFDNSCCVISISFAG